MCFIYLSFALVAKTLLYVQNTSDLKIFPKFGACLVFAIDQITFSVSMPFSAIVSVTILMFMSIVLNVA